MPAPSSSRTSTSPRPKAISGGGAYAAQLHDLQARGTGVDEALRALTTQDVRAACDTWDASDTIQALVRGGGTVDQDRLADPAVPLDQVAAG